ncbi:MAG: RagB/SusD family nutrient uptake outer membrane protein, partial [Rikenellaceae bacterium]
NNLGMRYGYKAEAFFIRAFYLFDLIQVYGGKSDSGEALGVPIINEYTTTDDAVDMLIDYKRNSYKDCVDQIMNDLDSAAYYFAMPNASAAYTIGRADAKIVEAFRSRVALYAASPAYQDDSVVKINGMGDFSVVNTDTYVDSWEEAAGITYESMVYNGVMAYRLLSSDLADASTSTPSEFIFRFYFNNRNLETGHFLPRYFGSSYTVPSQNLVDAFPMANGYPITHNDSGYDSNDPYVNRDSRFYLNIYYHGADYGESTYESEDLPLTKVDVLPGGLDSPTYGNSKNSYASQTGYYLAKFISKNFACNNPLSTTNVKHYCPEIRRVELLLNYAEAANEAWGPREYGSYVDGDNVSQTVAYSAYDIIKMIRAISLDGVSGGDGYLEEVADEGQDAFRELIYNERRLELAFENSRFFDLRRCLLDLTESVRGVSLTGSGEYDDDGNEIVAKYDTTVVVEERKYNGTHHYYLPLPYTEVVKGLENNMGW